MEGELIVTKSDVSEAMESAMLGGSGSAIVPLPTLQERRGVIRIDLPAHMARTWRITLGAPIVNGTTTPPMGGTWPTQLVNVPAVDWTRNTTFAIVRWGVGSVAHEAYVDWRGGTTFVVHASTITIDVQTASVVALLPAANQAITFRATCIPSEAAPPPPGSEGPTISQDSRTIAPAGVAQYAVPPFARRLRAQAPYLPVGAVTTLDGLVFEFFPAPAAVNGLGTYTFAGLALRSVASWDPVVPLPVPMNTKVIQVTNTAAAAKGVILEWLLDLG